MFSKTLVFQSDKGVLENLRYLTDTLLNTVGFRLIKLCQEVSVSVINERLITFRDNIFHTNLRGAVQYASETSNCGGNTHDTDGDQSKNKNAEYIKTDFMLGFRDVRTYMFFFFMRSVFTVVHKIIASFTNVHYNKYV